MGYTKTYDLKNLILTTNKEHPTGIMNNIWRTLEAISISENLFG